MQRATWTWARESIAVAAWAPILVLAAHVVAREGLDAYDRVPQFDVPMHFAGGVAAAFFFLRSAELASARGVLGSFTPLGKSLFALGGVSAVALAWEVMEWFARRAQPYVGLSFGRGSLDDTLLDLVVGLAGGAWFLAAAHWRSSISGPAGQVRRGRRTMP